MIAARFLVLLLPVLLSACKDNVAAEPAEVSRPVLTMTVQASDATASRLVAGVVRAERRSELALRLGGRVQAVTVDIGSEVEAGAPLVELDPTLFRLQVDQARAALGRAEAELDERQNQATVQRRLGASGWASEVAQHAAETALSAAESAADEARAALHLAERDLDDATLRAPYAGRIAERMVDPGVELSPGRPVLILDGHGPLEIVAAAPASIAATLRVGDQVSVLFAGLETWQSARLTRVGNREGAGLTVPIVAALQGDTGVVRPGAVAELLLPVPGEGGTTVPLGGVLPAASDGRAYVFLFDAERGTVVRREVGVAGADDAGVRVIEGLAVGDQVVAAGAAFLIDGQAASAMTAP